MFNNPTVNQPAKNLDQIQEMNEEEFEEDEDDFFGNIDMDADSNASLNEALE